MKSHQALKTAALIFVFFLVLYLISIYAMGSYMGFFSSKTDLKNNYDKKSEEIVQVANYIRNITPDDINVRFVVGHKGKLSAVTPNGTWEAMANSPEAEPLLNELGWSQETIATLAEMLKKANCVAVISKRPDIDAVFVEYKRNDSGYLLFKEPLTESQQKEYTGYGNTFYKDNIVFIHDDWWIE